MHPRITTVFFDAGNTLLRAHPGIAEVYVEVAARHGIDRTVEEIRTRFQAAWKKKAGTPQRMREEGRLTSEEVKNFWKSFVREIFSLSRSPEGFDAFFEELYERFADPDTWRTYDDVVPCLDALRGRGLALGVLSNWDERLPRILAGHGLDTYFETVVISAVEGWEKPAREIFEVAVERLGSRPGETLHVGDSPHDDFHGAVGAGLQAALLDRQDLFRDFQGRRIRSLGELVD
jgi:putative hydrolase of the HAD superfamily